MDEWLTLQEVADRTGIEYLTLHKRILTGKIKNYTRRGRFYFMRAEDADRLPVRLRPGPKPKKRAGNTVQVQ